VSVQTGISPTELLSLDGDMFEALLEAATERWSQELELAATHLEVAHAHWVSFLAANTEQKDHGKLPQPLQVERPGRPRPEDPERISLGELAALPGLSAELKGAS
jgi:hypothetical protein